MRKDLKLPASRATQAQLVCVDSAGSAESKSFPQYFQQLLDPESRPSVNLSPSIKHLMLVAPVLLLIYLRMDSFQMLPGTYSVLLQGIVYMHRNVPGEVGCSIMKPTC